MPGLRRHLPVSTWAPVIALAVSTRVALAQEPTAQEVIDRAESGLWVRTLQVEPTMTVTTSRWTRTLELAAWIEWPRR